MRKEIYKIWAPTGCKWVDWVRPVPFVGINYGVNKYSCNIMPPVLDFVIPKECAVIVDLPGIESVAMGITLAKSGVRPIPVYNGTIEQQGSRATVDNRSVCEALVWGAQQLKSIELKEDAIPAFLMDSNRMNRYKMEEGLFDNSWDIYPQDLPSAGCFLGNDINKIIIITDKLLKDINKILYNYQQKGMGIFITQGYDEPKKIKIRKTKYIN